jgi:hypothetical protein
MLSDGVGDDWHHCGLQLRRRLPLVEIARRGRFLIPALSLERRTTTPALLFSRDLPVVPDAE